MANADHIEAAANVSGMAEPPGRFARRPIDEIDEGLRPLYVLGSGALIGFLLGYLLGIHRTWLGVRWR